MTVAPRIPMATKSAPGGKLGRKPETIPATSGLKGEVTLKVDGLPTGALAGFNPPAVAASTPSTLGIITPEDVAAADYKLDSAVKAKLDEVSLVYRRGDAGS